MNINLNKLKILTGITLSLRNRFRLYLSFLATCLILISALLLPKLYERGLIDSASSILYVESNQFAENFKKNGKINLANSTELKGFIAIEQIPDFIKQHIDITALPLEQTVKTEWYEPIANSDEHSAEPTHFENFIIFSYVKRYDGLNNKLYLFHIIDISKRPGHAFSTIRKIQWGFGILGSMLVILLSHVLIKQVVKPIISLTDWINSVKQGHLPSKPKITLRKDEIGFVANSLFTAWCQSFEHHKKEQQFLQNASHELRTPIATIINAIELIKLQQQKQVSDHTLPLQRIERAGKNMKSVTEGLLWLARASHQETTKQNVNIMCLIQELLAQNEYLLNSYNLRFDVFGDENITLTIEKQLLSIALDNLIRNAIQHASNGQLVINFNQQELMITNRCDAEFNFEHTQILEQSIVSERGFGIGLSLVAKLAEICQWQFSINADGTKTIATLLFSPAQASHSL